MELRKLQFFHVIFCTICIITNRSLARAGRPTEEKLEQRRKDIESEVDQDGRPRRQLPTEINIQVTAPLFTARLYDYGKSEGDTAVPPSLDVGIKVDLQRPITFYEQKYNYLYILSNGAIGFDQNSRNYKSNILRNGPALIAPLWNRNDLRKGGQIYYREVTDGRIMERAQSEVRYQYDKNIKPGSVFLITWVNMQPMGEQNVKQDNANTVQCAIITSDNGTFINFIYKNIGWSQGAEAGFGKGDGQNFFSLPSSGTESIMFLKDYGNTGIPGEWMFEIDTPKVIRCKPGIKGDTCDNECSESEYGNDCENCCHCDKGKCNAVTGDCSSGVCKSCWNGPPSCNKREPDCKARVTKECGFNAISFSDTDKCGESVVRCQCLSGFVGDGYNCSDVDECTKKNICNQHAQCFNTPGRFYCECLPGFTGNGTSCVEINVDHTVESPTNAVVHTMSPEPQTNPVVHTMSHLEETSTEPIDVQSFSPEVQVNTSPNKGTPRPTTGHHHRQEVAHVLPKEPNSLLNYKLIQPLTIFGKLRQKMTVSSTGVIALDDVPNLNADDDLELLGIRGFAPFFARIDISKGTGKVYVAETTQSIILTDATTTVEQHFHVRGFLAKSVITVTYENVTTQSNQKPNTFQVVFIGGTNGAGENLTYIEYVYADLQWSDDAQAIILTDDPTNTIVLPGSGTDGVRQLSQLSNIQMSGEWMYRVDTEKIIPCPSNNLLPPYCESEPPAGPIFPTEPTLESPTGTRQPKPRPHLDFEDGGGEAISFPSFITVIPQLITAADNTPGDKPHPPSAITPVVIRPDLVTGLPSNVVGPSTRSPQGPNPNIILGPPRKTDSRENAKIPTPSIFINLGNKGSASEVPQGSQEIEKPTENRTGTPPLLQIFTSSKRPSRPTTRAQPKIVTASTNSPAIPPRGGDDSKKPLPPAVPSGSDDQEGLNSPSKLAIIIPISIVGVWLLLLLIIAIVVCCKRRRSRQRMRTNYDASYHFRHMPHSQTNTATRSKDTSTPGNSSNGNVAQSNGYPPPLPPPHVSYEDHLEKAARLAEMSSYSGQNGRAAMYGSYWNVPSSSRQPYSYYNQGYYESCPQFSRYNNNSNGRY